MSKRLALTFITFLCAAVMLTAAEDVPFRAASAEEVTKIDTAFSTWLSTRPSAMNLVMMDLFSPQIDSAFVTSDGQNAVIWLALVDENGRRLATEPGLLLAERTDKGWQIIAPGDPAGKALASKLPAGMLPMDRAPAPIDPETPANLPSALTGYYLPYAAGTRHRLEGSIAHFQDYPPLGYPSCAIETCHFAYDFTDSGHFPLLASRPGTVVASRDSCADGGTTCTNYIILRDANGTYQIYLHLARNTIPDSLVPTASVARGQYLGDTDDTGYSTSEHVHFMVTYDLWYGTWDAYPWGHSVDIRFADVAINSGIPRTCYEIALFPVYDGATACLGNVNDPVNPNNDWYVSGNVGAYPPTGAITRPQAGKVVATGSNPLMDVTVTASDDVAVKAVRLLAKLNNTWTEIGPLVTQPASPNTYDWDVNLCAVGPLNGALEIALRVWDHEGNVSGPLSARTIEVDHACPPPSSTLSLGQSFNSTAMSLAWNAETSGVPLASFELQYRNESNPVWSSSSIVSYGSAARFAWFVGSAGNAYGFRLRAIDANGQAEPWPENDLPEVVFTLPECLPDDYEPDDTPAQAFSLAFQSPQTRNLCGTLDPDWFKLTVTTPGTKSVKVSSLSGMASTTVSVYQGTSGPLIAEARSPSLGTGVNLTFAAVQAGVYTLRVTAWPVNLSGTDARYQLIASQLISLYLPLVRDQ